MQELALDKLYSSINELEKAVGHVQLGFQNRQDIPTNVHDRLSTYRDICYKQRQLWFVLEEEAAQGNCEKVVQLVIKINALSALLLDDIRCAIAALEGQMIEYNVPIN